MEKLAKAAALAVLIAALAGCGISSIKCEIETDDELLNRVLENHLGEIKDGLSQQNEKKKE